MGNVNNKSDSLLPARVSNAVNSHGDSVLFGPLSAEDFAACVNVVPELADKDASAVKTWTSPFSVLSYMLFIALLQLIFVPLQMTGRFFAERQNLSPAISAVIGWTSVVSLLFIVATCVLAVSVCFRSYAVGFSRRWLHRSACASAAVSLPPLLLPILYGVAGVVFAVVIGSVAWIVLGLIRD